MAKVFDMGKNQPEPWPLLFDPAEPGGDWPAGSFDFFSPLIVQGDTITTWPGPRYLDPTNPPMKSAEKSASVFIARGFWGVADHQWLTPRDDIVPPWGKLEPEPESYFSDDPAEYLW